MGGGASAGAAGSLILSGTKILPGASASTPGLRVRGRPRRAVFAGPASVAVPSEDISSSDLGGRDIRVQLGCACLVSGQGVHDAVDLFLEKTG